MKAKGDQSSNDVPVDVFRFEYFGQGDLAKVVEDPPKQPELLQEFQDRHTSLLDLITTAKLGQQLGAEISKTSALEISQPSHRSGARNDLCVFQRPVGLQRTPRQGTA